MYAKEHVIASINHTNAKDSKHKPRSNDMNNNEQSSTSANKQHAQTTVKHDENINNIYGNEDEHTKPLKYDIANDNLTHAQRVKLNNLLHRYKDIFSKHSYDLGEFTGAKFKIAKT